MTAVLAAVIALAAASDSSAPSRHGLWLGPIELCRGSVVAAELGSDRYTGAPIVDIRVDEQTRPRLAALTRAFVNRPLPLWLDGALVSSPLVFAEIRGGEMSVSAGERGPALRDAAMGPCQMAGSR